MCVVVQTFRAEVFTGDWKNEGGTDTVLTPAVKMMIITFSIKLMFFLHLRRFAVIAGI